MPTVKFYTDFEQDLEYINEKYTHMQKAFGEKKFNKFLKSYYAELAGKSDKEIHIFFLKNRREIMRKTVLDVEKVRVRWNKIEKEYFKQMEKITGFKWKHKTYYCHISSSFICGGGYRLPNTVVLFSRKKNLDPIMTICHELFHIHFIEFLQSKGFKINWKKFNELWDLSESMEFILAELKIKGLKYKIVLYPQHKNLYKKLKSIWKGDFEDFMEKALKIAACDKKKR